VVRVWQVPVETLLTGGLGTLPLAPISAVAQTALPDVVRRIDERLTREAAPEQAAVLGAAAVTLSGMRFPLSMLTQLYQGVHSMSVLEESSAFEWMRIRGAQKILLGQGRKRFGPPDQATLSAFEAILDLERLERMGERLLEVTTWNELLATP
jgi:hypothetical protein